MRKDRGATSGDDPIDDTNDECVEDCLGRSRRSIGSPRRRNDGGLAVVPLRSSSSPPVAVVGGVVVVVVAAVATIAPSSSSPIPPPRRRRRGPMPPSPLSLMHMILVVSIVCAPPWCCGVLYGE